MKINKVIKFAFLIWTSFLNVYAVDNVQNSSTALEDDSVITSKISKGLLILPWDVLNSDDQYICDEAVVFKVVKSAKKCVEILSQDKIEKFDIARDIYLSATNKSIKARLDNLYRNCEKSNSSHTKSKECKNKEKERLNKQKKSLIHDFEIAYAISKSRAEVLENEYDDKFKSFKLEKCGKRPIGANNSSLDDMKSQEYRNCVSKNKIEFDKIEKEVFNKKLDHIIVKNKEHEQVKIFCNKGAFNFLTDNYDKCIQQILKQNSNNVINNVSENDQQSFSKGPDSVTSVVGPSSEPKLPLITPTPVELDAKKSSKETRQTRQTEDVKVDCEDLVLKEIDSILKEDNENIIGKLYQITSLKIAKQVVENMGETNFPSISLESYITKQKKYYSSAQASKVLDLYKEHGRLLDAKFIDDNIVKSPVSYKGSRLDNDNVSAFILADVYSNPEKTAFNELDAATAWLMGRVGENSPFKVGSSGANLMNMSVLVYRNINLLAATRTDAEERIKRILTEQELKLNDLFSILQNNVESKLAKECSQYFDSPCWKGIPDVFTKKVAKSFVNLGKSVNSIDVRPGLSGSIGGKYKFNFLAKQFTK